MFPRGHRGRVGKRQGSLLLQPGAGVVFGSSGQNGPSISGQQPTSLPITQSSSVGSSTEKTSLQSNGKSSQSPVQQSSASATTSTPFSVDPDDFISNVLFGPSQTNDVMEPYSLATSSVLTDSSTPSTIATTMPTSLLASGSSQSGLTAVPGSSSSGTTSSFTTSTSTGSSTVSATPVSDVTPSNSSHSTQFYAGIVFLVIVVVACILSIVAWLLRSRRSRPSWCFGNPADDDVGGQEANLGLGIFLEKPSADVKSSWIQSSSVSDLTCSPHPYTLPTINRISDSPYPAMMRPPPVHVRTNTVESPGQLLGPLQVQNYMAGDFSSSSENLSKPIYTPQDSSLTSCRQDTFGTGRLPAPPAQVSPVPWVPLNLKSARTPEQVHISRSPAWRSIKAQHEDGHDSDIPPLPSPHFDRLDAPRVEDSNSTDGWGTSLRSSFFSALSAVRGQPTKPSEDRFTSLPSRNSSRQKPSVSVGDIFPSSFRALEINNGISASVSAPIAHIGEKTFWKSKDYNTTAPLTLRKKNTLIDGNDNPNVRRRSDSRASSVYTCTPGLPGSLTGKSKSTRRHAAALSGLSQISTRPPFLKRGTSGASVTTFSSTSSSEDTQGRTDDEALAKRVMMLRERRKKAMSRRATMLKQSSSIIASRSDSKHRDKVKA